MFRIPDSQPTLQIANDAANKWTRPPSVFSFGPHKLSSSSINAPLPAPLPPPRLRPPPPPLPGIEGVVPSPDFTIASA